MVNFQGQQDRKSTRLSSCTHADEIRSTVAKEDVVRIIVGYVWSKKEKLVLVKGRPNTQADLQAHISPSPTSAHELPGLAMTMTWKPPKRFDTSEPGFGRASTVQRLLRSARRAQARSASGEAVIVQTGAVCGW